MVLEGKARAAPFPAAAARVLVSAEVASQSGPTAGRTCPRYRNGRCLNGESVTPRAFVTDRHVAPGESFALDSAARGREQLAARFSGHQLAHPDGVIEQQSDDVFHRLVAVVAFHEPAVQLARVSLGEIGPPRRDPPGAEVLVSTSPGP